MEFVSDDVKNKEGELDNLKQVMELQDKYHGLEAMGHVLTALRQEREDSHQKMVQCMEIFDKYHQQMKG